MKISVRRKSFLLSATLLLTARLLVSTPLSAQTLAGGYSHTLARCHDGMLMQWGCNQFEGGWCGGEQEQAVPNVGPALANAIDVVTHERHSLALLADGTVAAWGVNSSGQLGTGTDTPSNTPVPVGPLNGIVSIACGERHSLVASSTGHVYAFGYNNVGQLGTGSLANSDVPVQLGSLDNITAVAAGAYHSLALRSDGTSWAWGNNSSGALGNGTNVSSTVPVQVSITGLIAVDGGEYHSVGLRNDGTVWTWGSNGYGQLGVGTYNNANAPQQVPGLTGIVVVAAGMQHTLALKNDGTVWAWGYNGAEGVLGIGSNVDDAVVLVQVAGLTNVSAIAAGRGHSLALKSDGTLWSWGLNDDGQLGVGNYTDSNVPMQVNGLCPLVTAVAAHHQQATCDLFPNPGNGDFTLRLDPRSATVAITVIDASGRSVLHRQVANTGQLTIHGARHMQPGMYMVRVDDGIRAMQHRLVVQ